MAADDVHIKDATIAPILVQIQPLSMAKEFKLKSKWKFKSMVVCRDDHLVSNGEAGIEYHLGCLPRGALMGIVMALKI